MKKILLSAIFLCCTLPVFGDSSNILKEGYWKVVESEDINFEIGSELRFWSVGNFFVFEHNFENGTYNYAVTPFSDSAAIINGLPDDGRTEYTHFMVHIYSVFYFGKISETEILLCIREFNNSLKYVNFEYSRPE